MADSWAGAWKIENEPGTLCCTRTECKKLLKTNNGLTSERHRTQPEGSHWPDSGQLEHQTVMRAVMTYVLLHKTGLHESRLVTDEVISGKRLFFTDECQVPNKNVQLCSSRKITTLNHHDKDCFRQESSMESKSSEVRWVTFTYMVLSVFPQTPY